MLGTELACLGCGAGIGAALSALVQQPAGGEGHGAGDGAGRTGRFEPHPTVNGAVPDARARGRSRGSTAGSVHASDAECDWLNAIVSILWPRIDEYFKDAVERSILPAVDEALPRALRGCVHVERLSIGASKPQFRGFSVVERDDDAIVLNLQIDVLSDLDIMLVAMKVPVGVRAFNFHGTLVVVLRPPSAKPPFFGGLEVYFVNPPELEISFTGAAGVADWPMLRSVIHETLIGAITKAMVVPARIAVDLNDEDAVTVTELKFPGPVGVLRLVLKSGHDLYASDFSISGRRSSDPYVVVDIGQQRWRSSTVQANLNPVFTHDNIVDLVVFDLDQVVDFRVFDQDRFSKDDQIGEALHVPLRHLHLGRSFREAQVPLARQAAKDGSGDGEMVSAGALCVCTRWFELDKEAPVKGISQAAAEGPSQLTLAARLEELTGAPPSGAPFFVRLSVSCRGAGGDFRATSSGSTPPPRAPPSTQQQLRKVCANLVQQRWSAGDVERITGMTAEHVRDLARGDPASEMLAQARTQCFHQILRLPLPWTQSMMTEGLVTLDLLDCKRKRLGCFKMNVHAIAAEEALGPFDFGDSSGGVQLVGRLSVSWLKEAALDGAS